MQIQLVDTTKRNYDVYIIPTFTDKVMEYPILSTQEQELLAEMVEQKEFTGKAESILSCNIIYKHKPVQVTYVGLGDWDKIKPYTLITSLYKALKGATGEIFLGTLGIEVTHAVEAIHYGSYSFKKYKNSPTNAKSKGEKTPSLVDLYVEKKDTLQECALEEGKVLAESVMLTRNLINEPANVIYPESLAATITELGGKYGFEVSVYQEKEIEALKMEAFLSVARAAEKRPRLIVMRYMGDPEHPEKIDGLVGKGLTYDTGGLCLKPAGSMLNMKMDMGGAATVTGTICALARMKSKRNVVAVIAACENSIGGNAYRPGDIINSMGGKTIEILNTDAEGRLTLIDAVYYAIHKEKVTEVVDVATLTGAVTVALGNTTTGVLSNRTELYNLLEEASFQAGERVWRLPNFGEYKELYKSEVADLRNGAQGAGTITAGMFIEEFVEDTPWMHLDIAGTAFAAKPYGYYPYGGTGQMVRTLYYYYVNK